MLYFGIPFKARCVSTDWERVNADLERTLRSVLRQTDPRFRVILAYTDAPEFEIADERVEGLQVPCISDTPHVRDKLHRVFEIGKRIRTHGGGTLMPVDADDWLSNRVAEWINERPQCDGFYARTGIELDERNGRLRVTPSFWKLCGTSIAVRFRPEELPDEATSEHLLRKNHNFWLPQLQATGKTLHAFPSSPAIYRLYNRESLNFYRFGKAGWRRRLFRSVVPSYRPSSRHREEFALGE